MILYYWVGSKSKLVFSYSKKAPRTVFKERLRYVGWTEDLLWPKKMSTGRMLHHPSSFQKNKNKKEAVSNSHK